MSSKKINSLILGIALVATFITASAMNENKQTLRESVQLTNEQIQLIKPEYLKQRHFLEPHAVKYLDKYLKVTTLEIAHNIKNYKAISTTADDITSATPIFSINSRAIQVSGTPVTEGQVNETFDPLTGQSQQVFFVGEPHLGIGKDNNRKEALVISYNESKESRLSQATQEIPEVVSFPSFSGFAIKETNGFRNLTMPGHVPCSWNSIFGSICLGNMPLGDQVVLTTSDNKLNILDIEAVGGSTPIDLRIYELENSTAPSFPYFKSGGLINSEREFFALFGTSLSDKPWGISEFVGTKTVHLGLLTEYGPLAVSDGIYIAPRNKAFLNEIQLKSHYRRVSPLKGSWANDGLVTGWQNVHMAKGKGNTLVVVWLELIGQQLERVKIWMNTVELDGNGEIKTIGESKVIANPGPTGAWSDECTSRTIKVSDDPTQNARHIPGISLTSDPKTGTVNLFFSRRDAGNDLGGIYWMQSTDNGQTWSNQKRLTPEPGVQFNPDSTQEENRLAVSYNQVLQENGVYKNYKMAKTSTDGGLTWQTFQLGDPSFMDFISRDPLVRTCHYEEYGGIVFHNGNLQLAVTQAFKEFKSSYDAKTKFHVPQIFYYEIYL
ncbi:MAG: exo-alpha-sialidase [Parcubacteria group bacterium]|nr:exo-alpha-sialidase [Parcubacteria group bacterium]